MAQVPYGHPKAQREYLVEMMAGAAYEFNKMKTAIAGGHSIEGPRMALGFTVMANQVTKPLLKSNLRDGDQLILTKALGTGALLAGLMDGKLRGFWFEKMIRSMLLNNSIALEIARNFDVSAMTDVTGFGLAGHLFEMLIASHKSAQLQPESIPLLDGFAELTAAGIESTMTPENRSIENSFQAPDKLSNRPPYVGLFDPQTCGGLLIAVGKPEATEVLDYLRQNQFESAAIIGSAQNSTAGVPTVSFGSSVQSNS
jgi:selenide,water dikinase